MLRAATADRRPPLAETLSRAAAVEVGGKRLAVGFGPPDGSSDGLPVGSVWATPADLSSDADLLDGLLARSAAGYGTADPAVATSLFLKGYLWRLLSPAVAAFLLDRRLLDLGPKGVVFRFDEEGNAAEASFLSPGFAALPGDPEAGHPEARVVPSEDDLLGLMRGVLAGEHLPDLFAALRPRARRGRAALWGMAVDACADAFAYVGRELGREDEARARAVRLLSGPAPLCGPTNYFAPEHAPDSGAPRARNVCCLHYKLGGSPCASCPRALPGAGRRPSEGGVGGVRATDGEELGRG